MTAFILFVLVAGNGPAINSARFESETACLQAAATVEKELDYLGSLIRTACVPEAV